MSHWALIVTAPNAENTVSRKLARAKIEFLYVKRAIVRIWRGRKVERFIAAFPRYIFVFINDMVHEAIRNISGIIDYVRIGIAPAVISEKIIDDLRARIDRNGVLPFIKESRFHFGERVMVRGAGLASGYAAIFQYPVEDNRVCILQEWMGRLVPIQIDESDIEKIGSSVSTIQRKRNRRKIYRRSYQPALVCPQGM